MLLISLLLINICNAYNENYPEMAIIQNDLYTKYQVLDRCHVEDNKYVVYKKEDEFKISKHTSLVSCSSVQFESYVVVIGYSHGNELYDGRHDVLIYNYIKNTKPILNNLEYIRGVQYTNCKCGAWSEEYPHSCFYLKTDGKYIYWILHVDSDPSVVVECDPNYNEHWTKYIPGVYEEEGSNILVFANNESNSSVLPYILNYLI